MASVARIDTSRRAIVIVVVPPIGVQTLSAPHAPSQKT
jgi:hypothetical protein